MATKKDYELVAATINTTLRDHIRGGNSVPRAFAVKLISNMADSFALQSPNFNRTVFYNACVKGLKLMVDDNDKENYSAPF